MGRNSSAVDCAEPGGSPIRHLLLLGIFPLTACGEVSPPDCSTLTDPPARNQCQLNRVLALEPQAFDQLVSGVAAMSDPIARGAAVFGWLEAHPNTLTPAQGQQLCALLKDENKRICERRQASSHLSRP